MRTHWVLFTGCLLAACSASPTGDEATAYSLAQHGRGAAQADDDDDEGEEERIELGLVPAAAKAAALAAVPGFLLEKAEKEGADTYCLHGTADGVFTEVEVSGSGQVLEIEQGPDEDDD